MTASTDSSTRSSVLEDAIAQLFHLSRAFSCPDPSYSHTLDDLVPMIVREYAAGLTGAYLARHLDRIEQSSPDLAAYLGSWAADPDGSTTERQSDTPVIGWDYAFGDAYRTLLVADADHARVATSLGAHIAASGVRGSWSIKLQEPLRLRWDDWLLPAADVLAVEANATDAAIEYSGPTGSGQVRLVAAGGRWDAHGAEAHRRVKLHGVNFTVLVRDALAMRDYEDLLERAVPSVNPRMFDVFAEALDLLAEYAPEYLPWVGRTLHQLFLLRPRPSKVESGSVEHYLGLVHLTEHPEPLTVAELLVHEATHQYMNVLTKLRPLDDGTDERLYWSPAVDKNRPVSKIVAAFHAFGNVLLLYRACRERGLPNRQECDRQDALLGGWMHHLVPPIVDNPALTETGNGLCRPLLERLRAA